MFGKLIYLSLLQAKLEMIQSLMEIEIAYNMMETKTSGDSTVHPLDLHYLKLNCAIDVSCVSRLTLFFGLSYFLCIQLCSC